MQCGIDIPSLILPWFIELACQL